MQLLCHVLCQLMCEIPGFHFFTSSLFLSLCVVIFYCIDSCTHHMIKANLRSHMSIYMPIIYTNTQKVVDTC